ncbi:MAG TPA: IS1634 family transposase [Tepidisphaeraceae bacterium]|nr:IS1634 family transposase [Tepidisphaeraceae bacterium]
MYLRKLRPRGRGKKQVYWELVESYRTAKGSRQRTVAYLGKLSRNQINGWQTLSSRLNGQAPSTPGLFDPPGTDDEPEFEIVDLKNLAVQRPRNFGDVYLAWTLWRLLGLDVLLSQHMPAGREEVPWGTVAAILCIARFCRPSSELFIEKHFYPVSALEDLVGVEAAKVHTDRLYAGLDELLKQKKTIEQHLHRRLGQLFELSYDLLLYDLTSTYFEGQCSANPIAQRGYSRDSRPDCPQVVIALVVTAEGYPVGYEVFDGNTADSTTVQEIVEKVEAEHGKAGRIWVMDRGNVSEANLSFIRERGGRYIVGTPKALLRQVRGQITAEGWREVREGIQVKTVTCQDNQKIAATETLILCRSEDRLDKEAAMLDRFVQRMEEGLEAMKKSAEKGRLTDILAAHMRLGRLVDKNWRAAECFAVKIEEKDGQLRITWTKDEKKKRELCGCYLLRTNLPDADPVAMWQQYIQLVDAEWAFRISKDELELRPIWHHHEDRVKGHILVCFIAYAMWKTLSGWMKSSGLGEAPRPLVEELAAIKSGDVLLPTRSADGMNGPTLVVRCVTRPDEHQTALLARLGLEIPNQIKRYRLEAGTAQS